MICTPIVSVVLPCRDAAATLHDALESLSVQTFEAMEVIVVDDGSTDETPSILDHWSERDARFRVLRSHPHGIVAALDAGAKHARGRLLARMDADDLIPPQRFERQVAFLDAHPRLVACGTRVRYFPRRLVRAGARRYERWINALSTPEQIERDLFVECPIPHPSLVVRRHAFEAVGGYRDLGWPEDYDLLLRLWSAGHRFGNVPEVLLDWRERADRLSRTHPRYSTTAFRRCKVHFLGRRIDGRAVVMWGAGPVGKAFARELKGQGHELAAFVDLDPRKIGQTIHDVPVIPPGDIASFRGAYVLAGVAGSPARTEIRATLHSHGFREPEDFCAVA